MASLVSKIYLIIILYTCWSVYEKYENYNKQVASLGSQVPVLKARFKKKEKEKKQLESYYDDIKNAKHKIERVALEIEKIQKQLPSEISDTDNLSLISKLAEDLNIKNIFLAPGQEEDKSFYFTKLYNIKGSGTFLQWLVFLEKIGANERLLNIHNIKMVQSTVRQRGRFQSINAEMNIEVYRYNPNYKEDRGINKIEGQFKTGNNKR